MGRSMGPSTTPRLAQPPSSATTLAPSSEVGDTTLMGDGPPRSTQDAPLRRGVMLGRYIVLDVLGRGGMGIVYAAYDPELDRKVAIKLLLPGRDRGAAARLRFQREAQAIARLSHPHVVAVHDVGSVGERVFIAMELVDGMDLARWLAAAPRSPGEVLEVFLQAATGLEAAHAAELVHRDFKPENVLVGRDGRARVVDFGLVRKDDTASSSSVDLPEELGQGRSAAGQQALHLTEAGGVLGTPAYMAPEQFWGAASDARTDQFSFCVALYEALYGERPFAGDDLPALTHAVTHGEVRPPSPERAVPGRLRRVLLRGLATRPEDRHESMATLMSALRKAAAPRRGWWAAAGLVVVGGSATAWAVATHEPACAHASDRAVQVWGPATQADLERQLEQLDRPYAASAWKGLQTGLDGYVASWSALQHEVCEANEGLDPTAAAEDPRQRCLDEHMDQVEEVLSVLREGGARAALQAVPLVDGLPEPSACADRDNAIASPIPVEPGLREQVRALRAELRHLQTAAKAGLGALDEASVTGLAERAHALGYAPLEAELLDIQADVASARGDYDRAVDLANEAFETALASRHDIAAFTVATGLLFLHGVERREPAEAHRWAHRAEALAKRLGDGPRLRMQLLSNWASAYAQAGDYEEARARYEEALAIVRELDEPLNLATLLNNMGAFLAQAGRQDEAVGYLEEAAERQRALLGAEHPTVLRTEVNLGIVSVMSGRHAAGRDVLEALLPHQEAALGPSHPEVANTLEALAIALARTGPSVRSEGLRRRVLEARRQRFEPTSQPVRAALLGLMEQRLLARGFEEAHALATEALGLMTGSKDVPPQDRVRALVGLGWALRGLGRAAEAEAPLAEARALCEASACKHEADVLTIVGDVELALGHAASAREAFERALVLRPEGPDAAPARFGLARVVAADDRAGAQAQARQALAQTEGDARFEALAREIEAWLREQG
jgi:tetratricopeptide (TPR) repeat protein